MSNPVIVVHYHELWLKGGNRRFFLGKLCTALRQSFQGIPVERIEQPGDRFIIRLGAEASLEEAIKRLERVPGIAYYAVARPVERSKEARSDKTFPHSTMEIESIVGRTLLEHLRADSRDVRVRLKDPDVTCHVEITPGPLLVYARKIQGMGGLPPNTAGRMTCLLSGGYDSAVAAYHMMKRGAHLSFVHFYGTGAQPGESSLHIASGLARTLTQYQFRSKLYRVPFEAIQREIVRAAPEGVRILLYRRMMLRIAEAFARRDRALALVTGDSLGQVASQTLRNLVAVDAAARMPVFRPLIGTDKMEILATAKKIGTYETSSEPFHDCCPVFMPRQPELYASPRELDEAEANLDIRSLVTQGAQGATLERFAFTGGRVEATEPTSVLAADQSRAAIA
jgi:thiamine biosynthesis protein ThiI